MQLSREFRDTADVFYFVQSSASCQVDNANEEVSNKLPGSFFDGGVDLQI